MASAAAGGVEDALALYLAKRKSDLLGRFNLGDVVEEICEKPLPKTCVEYARPVLMAGDTPSGALDGHTSKGLAVLFESNPPKGTKKARFTRRQLEDGFDIRGTIRDPSLGPSRGEFKGRAEIAAEIKAKEEELARQRAAEQARRAEAEARRHAELMEKYKSVELDAATLKELHNTAVEETHGSLVRMSWPDWLWNNGNPFVVKITRNNCKSLGLANYFSVVKSPMDLTRIGEKVARGKYPDWESLTADVDQIVANAHVYNREGDPVHGMASTLHKAYHEQHLPAGKAYYDMLVDKEKMKRYKEFQRAELAKAKAAN